MSDIAAEHSYTSCADDDLTNIGWCKRCTDLALAERVTLLAWKAEAREVMDSIDIQAVGKELGVKLGRPIGPAILPGIRALKARLK